jgi:hypothetical protein
MLIALLTIVERTKPVKHSWVPTLINTDKNPYGAYILYHELKTIFPDQKIIESRLPVLELELSDNKHYTYLIITPDFITDTLKIQEILNFAAKGNTLFVSSERFSPEFLKALGLELKLDLKNYLADDTTLYFSNPYITCPDFNVSQIGKPCLVAKDSLADVTEIIKSRSGDVKMVKVSYQSGNFFLCTVPLMFSNYAVLNSTEKAAAIALSYLPQNETIIWDEYFKQGRDEIKSPIRYILKNRSTRWAYFMTLTGLLLFLLFQIKRRRSMIPVVEPFQNTSLQFLQAVALLHYDKRDYSDIAGKKVRYFFEGIRQKLYISTTLADKDFVTQLSSKTAYPETDTASLVKLCRQVLEQGADYALFIELNKKIEDFRNKTGIQI